LISLKQEQNFSGHHGTQTAIIAPRITLQPPASSATISSEFFHLNIIIIAGSSPPAMTVNSIVIIIGELID